MAGRLLKETAKHFKSASIPDALHPRHSAREQGAGLHRPAIFYLGYPSRDMEPGLRIPSTGNCSEDPTARGTRERKLDLHILAPRALPNTRSL